MLRFDGEPPDAGVTERMTLALAHRGPDAHRTVADTSVQLGHRRLAVVDPGSRGDQPMSHAEGSLQLVFNGEIYNHGEHRRRLEAKGHRFRTRTDTEVILHLYEERGEDCVESLRGMFAFALWDRRRRRLLLARDRLGQKPLYYYAGSDCFVFASEIKALLENPAVPRGVDLRRAARLPVLRLRPRPGNGVRARLAAAARPPDGDRRTRPAPASLLGAVVPARPQASRVSTPPPARSSTVSPSRFACG